MHTEAENTNNFCRVCLHQSSPCCRLWGKNTVTLVLIPEALVAHTARVILEFPIIKSWSRQCWMWHGFLCSFPWGSMCLHCTSDQNVCGHSKKKCCTGSICSSVSGDAVVRGGFHCPLCEGCEGRQVHCARKCYGKAFSVPAEHMSWLRGSRRIVCVWKLQ